VTLSNQSLDTRVLGGGEEAVRVIRQSRITPWIEMSQLSHLSSVVTGRSTDEAATLSPLACSELLNFVKCSSCDSNYSACRVVNG
jgi:hypothetical protein